MTQESKMAGWVISSGVNKFVGILKTFTTANENKCSKMKPAILLCASNTVENKILYCRNKKLKIIKLIGFHISKSQVCNNFHNQIKMVLQNLIKTF